MKHDLEPVIMDGLRELYGLQREDTNYIYRYLCMRTSILYNKRKINDRDLFKFILEELNLTVFKDDNGLPSHLIYKGEEHSLLETSRELLDNLVFRAELEGSIDYKEDLEEIFKKGYRQAHKYRPLPSYKYYLILKRLEELNQLYGADPAHMDPIEGFETGHDHNPFERTLEERMEIEIEVSEQAVTESTSYITEEDLENYLINNLDLIESGLVFIKRQVDVPGGFIDILAKDVNGNYCIIELKTKEDKSIIWQTLHYPKEVKKLYRGREVRMLTVVPTYSSHIYEALKSVVNGTINNVEMYQYDIKTASGDIKDLKIYKR